MLFHKAVMSALGALDAVRHIGNATGLELGATETCHNTNMHAGALIAKAWLICVIL
jgi:hypothetical protein